MQQTQVITSYDLKVRFTLYLSPLSPAPVCPDLLSWPESGVRAQTVKRGPLCPGMLEHPSLPHIPWETVRRLAVPGIEQ